MNKKLLRDAAEWRLISLLFECPGKEWQTQVAGLAKEVADPKLKEAAKAAREEASESLYHSTLGPGGPAAPREVSYRQSLMPGQMLDEISAYYNAFAYQPIIPEPPDHIAVMTGFMGYMRLKESLGNTEQAEITAKAAKKFLDGHLNSIAEPLAKSLAHSGIRYLGLASEVLLQRVGPCRQVAVAPVTEACGGCGDEAASD
jgi:nitrate reductase assembly molybdenum cofactor insertion protein NarJ